MENTVLVHLQHYNLLSEANSQAGMEERPWDIAHQVLSRNGEPIQRQASNARGSGLPV
jgi:hypothetical protein